MATREELIKEIKRKRLASQIRAKRDAVTFDQDLLVRADDARATQLGVLGEQALLGVTDIGTGVQQRALEASAALPAGGISIDRPVADVESLTVRSTFKQQALDLARDLGETQQQRTEEASGRAEQFPVTAFLGRTGAQIAALPVPGVSTGSFVVRTGSAAGTGALAGFLQPTDQDGDPRLNAVTGAAVAGAFNIFSEPFSRIVRKRINARTGEFKKDGMAQAIREADELGVELFADDVMDSPFVRFVGRAAEEVPVTGTSPGRVRQAVQQKNAVQDFLAGVRRGMKFGLDEIPLDDIDLDQVQLKSLSEKFSQRRAFKNKLWERVISKGGTSTVNLSRTRSSAMRELVDHVSSATGTPTEAVEEAMEPIIRGRASIDKITQALDNTPAGDSGLVRELLKFARAPEGDTRYTIQSLKPSLNDLINKGSRGENAVIKSPSVPILQRVKESLDADLKNFATGKPGMVRALSKANEFTSRFNIEGKKTKLRNILSEGGQEVPEKIMTVLSAGKKSENKLLYRNLTSDGRAAVRISIIQNALENSLDESGNFIAKKFNKSLQKMSTTTGVFFKGQDAREFRGLERLLRRTEAASRQFDDSVGINTLGRRIVTPQAARGAATGGLGVLGIFDPATAASTAGGILGVGAVARSMLQNKTGRNLLIALGSTTPGTKEFDRLVERAVRFLSRAAIVPAPTQPEE